MCNLFKQTALYNTIMHLYAKSKTVFMYTDDFVFIEDIVSLGIINNNCNTIIPFFTNNFSSFFNICAVYFFVKLVKILLVLFYLYIIISAINTKLY